mmetsp:Transcript_16782/g.29944  ORF Transcript_16782/g.29944 Transcript_16782/m.29944 type:complete len:463 (-) Transcript_16782:2-1390(-)
MAVLFKSPFLCLPDDERMGPARRCTSVPPTWKPLPFQQDRDITLPAGASNVRIEVRNVSGDVLMLDVEGSMTVAMLKRELARRWSIPPVCQQLALGTTVISMESNLPLGLLVDPSVGEPALSVVMVVSAEYAVQAVLNSQHAERQLEALRGLVHISSQGGEAAIAAVIQCFSSGNHDTVVRRAAVIALSEMVQQGAGVATDELCSACVWEPAPKIRLEALRALMHTAAEVDERVIVCLGCCLQDDDIHVRSEAINFIARAANVDCHERIMAEIRPRLDDQQAFVRKAAVQCLARVAEKGDHFAVPLVISRLEDPDVATRCAALHSVSRMVEKGDHAATLAVGARLTDFSAEVRCAAVEALSHIAERGDSKTCALLKECLKDKDLVVRDLASEALSHLDADGSDSDLIFRSSLSWPPAHSWELPHSNDRQAEGEQERLLLAIPAQVEDFMEQLLQDCTPDTVA